MKTLEIHYFKAKYKEPNGYTIGDSKEEKYIKASDVAKFCEAIILDQQDSNKNLISASQMIAEKAVRCINEG